MQPGDRAEAVIHQISELREKFSEGISPQRHDGTKRKRMNGLPDRTALNDLEGCGLSEPWCAGLDKGVNEAARNIGLFCSILAPSGVTGATSWRRLPIGILT
jgi:hypothetical protein